MLNFTTTTIVNTGDTVVANASKKMFRVNFGPELYNDGTIHVAKLVGKQAYKAAKNAAATITLPTADGIYRIAMYIRLRNNNNPYFSNEFTFKGKPLYIEFSKDDSVDNIISRAKKFMLAQYGYDLVKFSKDTDGNLVITAANQWEIFMDQDANDGVKIQKLETVDTTGKVVTGTTTLPTHEEFVNGTYGTVTVNNGNEAFGDFAHIVKDLRLPTDANRRWQGIAEGDVFDGEPNDDKPMPDGKYTQYTIQYNSERGVLQQTALGGVAKSRTVHVFYVESAAVSAFETALTTSTIGTTVADAELV